MKTQRIGSVQSAEELVNRMGIWTLRRKGLRPNSDLGGRDGARGVECT